MVQAENTPGYLIYFENGINTFFHIFPAMLPKIVIQTTHVIGPVNVQDEVQT